MLFGSSEVFLCWIHRHETFHFSTVGLSVRDGFFYYLSFIWENNVMSYFYYYVYFFSFKSRLHTSHTLIDQCLLLRTRIFLLYNHSVYLITRKFMDWAPHCKPEMVSKSCCIVACRETGIKHIPSRGWSSY